MPVYSSDATKVRTFEILQTLESFLNLPSSNISANVRRKYSGQCITAAAEPESFYKKLSRATLHYTLAAFSVSRI